ncbi:MAG: type VII toxin-antitoxin system MntA family adenylyltransferase antitoxin [Actinomycetota bacterium]
MATEVLDRLKEGAEHAFGTAPVLFAYLFGSQATGTARPDSDVDVAVFLAHDAGEDHLQTALDLPSALFDTTNLTDIEVTVLNGAPLRIVGRVLGEGQLFFSVDEPSRVAFESRKLREYWDWKPRAEDIDRALLRAIAEGRR